MTSTYNNNKFNNTKLVEFNCYKTKNKNGAGSLCARAVYEYENEKGKYRLVVPKIPLALTDAAPVINSEYGLIDERVYINMGCGAMEIAMTDDKMFYCIEEIEKKPQKMTLSEIERKLGCKIELVNEKEEVVKTCGNCRHFPENDACYTNRCLFRADHPNWGPKEG